MKTKNLFSITLALCAILLAAPRAAIAHFVWATIDKGQARFAQLENPNETPDAKFTRYVAKANAWTTEGRKLTLSEPKDGARYVALPAGATVVMADSPVGVTEREGQSFRLDYHAKAAVNVEAAATSKTGMERIRLLSPETITTPSDGRSR